MSKKKRRRKKKGGAGPFLLVLLLGGAAGAGYFLKDCAFGFGTGTGEGSGEGEGEGEGQTDSNDTTDNPNAAKVVVTVSGESIAVTGSEATTVEAVCAELKAKKSDNFSVEIVDEAGQQKIVDDIKKCATDNGVKIQVKSQ